MAHCGGLMTPEVNILHSHVPFERSREVCKLVLNLLGVLLCNGNSSDSRWFNIQAARTRF